MPIFEIGQHEGQHYFSMAFVDGESLAHRVAQGVMEPREAASLMKQVAEAIAYAHAQGVIHRDLKPGNILLASGGRQPADDAEPAAEQSGGSRPSLAKTRSPTPLAEYTPRDRLWAGQAGGERGP